jgi:hypothetical protein
MIKPAHALLKHDLVSSSLLKVAQSQLKLLTHCSRRTGITQFQKLRKEFWYDGIFPGFAFSANPIKFDDEHVTDHLLAISIA